MPLGWPGRKADALRRAIGAVQHVETDSTHIPAPVDTTMVLRAWQATSATCSEEKVRRLPRDERDGELATSTPTSMPARTSSTVIRVAKFGTSSGVRARAFYLEWGTPLTVKFAVGTLRARSRLRREVSVRREVGADLPAPALIDAGTTKNVSYLVEPVVFGSHPRDHAEKQALALRLVEQLLVMHRSAGVQDQPLELHTHTAERITHLLGFEWAHDLAGSVNLGALADPMARILADERHVPVGWGHGDLGFSNVILSERGAPVIVDWEHSGRMPAVADLAKVAVMAPDPPAVAERILGAATPADIGGNGTRMPVTDQLAAMLIRELSWWEARQARAVDAGRLLPFRRGVGRRVQLLAFLVAAGAGRP